MLTLRESLMVHAPAMPEWFEAFPDDDEDGEDGVAAREFLAAEAERNSVVEAQGDPCHYEHAWLEKVPTTVIESILREYEDAKARYDAVVRRRSLLAWPAFYADGVMRAAGGLEDGDAGVPVDVRFDAAGATVEASVGADMGIRVVGSPSRGSVMVHCEGAVVDMNEAVLLARKILRVVAVSRQMVRDGAVLTHGGSDGDQTAP